MPICGGSTNAGWRVRIRGGAAPGKVAGAE